MSAAEALARLLFEWNTPTDPYFVIKGRAGDVDERDPYIPIVEALLADPGPLLEALAEAGVLATEVITTRGCGCSVPVGNDWESCCFARADPSADLTERRYVSEWRPTDARP